MKNKPIIFALFFFIAFLIIYFYFRPYRTTVIYGDDLIIYRTFFGLQNSFAEKMKLSRLFNQFRPVKDFFTYIVVNQFDKNVYQYFVFNTGILALNTVLFARILSLFTKSLFAGLLLSLAWALSRLSYYSATQLFNGGVLEGVALAFFFLSLYSLLRTLVGNDVSAARKYRGLLLAILYANLSMYTHERYVVMLAFIAGIVLLFPSLKVVGTKRKALLLGMSIFSVILPFYIKSLAGIRVLMGTGGTDIDFKLASMSSFFADAVLSICQINTGPAYLVGMPYSSLQPLNKATVAIIVISIVLILGLYISQMCKEVVLRRTVLFRIKVSKVRKAYAQKFNERRNNFKVVFFLIGIFILLLIPAVVTIRIELRFLHAAFAILILALAIAISAIKFISQALRVGLVVLLVAIFVFNDYTYLKGGTKNLFNTTTDNVAIKFHEAMEDGTIRAEAKNLFIWERHRNPDRENEVNFITSGGGIFETYQGKSKNYVYIDSLYKKTDSGYRYSLSDFNEATDQIIFLDIKNNGESFLYAIKDLSEEFRKDSLKNFAQLVMKE